MQRVNVNAINVSTKKPQSLTFEYRVDNCNNLCKRPPISVDFHGRWNYYKQVWPFWHVVILSSIPVMFESASAMALSSNRCCGSVTIHIHCTAIWLNSAKRSTTKMAFTQGHILCTQGDFCINLTGVYTTETGVYFK